MPKKMTTNVMVAAVTKELRYQVGRLVSNQADAKAQRPNSLGSSPGSETTVSSLRIEVTKAQ